MYKSVTRIDSIDFQVKTDLYVNRFPPNTDKKSYCARFTPDYMFVNIILKGSIFPDYPLLWKQAVLWGHANLW